MTPLSLPKPYLSYSQVSLYLQCPRRYERAYVRGERGPTTAAMAFGSAVHRGVEVAVKHQIEHQAEIHKDALAEAVLHATNKELGEVAAWDDVFQDDVTSKQRFHRWAQHMTQSFVRNRLPQLRPVASESHLRVMLDGRVPFHAVIDLVEEYPESGIRVIRDVKVTGKPYPPRRLEESLQLSIYAYLTKAQAVGYELFVRPSPGQTGQLVSQPPNTREGAPTASTRTEAQLLHAAAVVVEVAEQISKGNFPRTDPGSWSCNGKWCPLFQSCRGNAAVGTNLHPITVEPLEVSPELESIFADAAHADIAAE